MRKLMFYFLLSSFFLLNLNLKAQLTRVLIIGGDNQGIVTDMLQSFVSNDSQNLYIRTMDEFFLSFDDIINQTDAYNRISSSSQWDYVFIENLAGEYSYYDSILEVETYPFAQQINNKILQENPCTETVYIMPAAYEFGDQNQCLNFPQVCTFDGMQDRIKEASLEIANQNNALVAPVGEVYRALNNLYPSIDLFGPNSEDRRRYVAACVYFCSMFRTSIVNNNAHYLVDSLEAFQIRTVVSSVVLDNLQLWRIGTNDIVLDVSDTLLCGDSIFVTCFNSEDRYEWSSGDTTEGIWIYSFGEYSITSTNERNCTLTESFQVDTSEIVYAKYFGCDSVFFQGIWYKNDTVYYHYSQNNEGCDSTYIELINVSNNQPIAEFDYTSAFPYYAFSPLFLSTSSNYDTLFWYDASSYIFQPNYITQDTFEVLCDYYVLVTLVAVNSCGVDTAQIEHVCEAIREIEDLNWLVFPNPSNDYIEISNEDNLLFKVQFLDLTGRILHQTNEVQKGYLKLDISSYDLGDYFLIFLDEQDIPIGKKMIQKF